MFGSFFVLNLLLAVLESNYNEQEEKMKEEEEARKKEKAERKAELKGDARTHVCACMCVRASVFVYEPQN